MAGATRSRGENGTARVTSGRKGGRVRRRQVALLIETSNAYARGLLQGVVHYIREHEPWSFYLMEQGRGDDPPAWLNGWEGDGIIARIETARIAEVVVKAGVPTVDVSAARLVPELPWVETEDEQIARLAAEHLLERGFRHFAFCGDARFKWSEWRENYFRVWVERGAKGTGRGGTGEATPNVNCYRAG